MRKETRWSATRWTSWLAYSFILILATVGIASVLVVRSTRALIVDDTTTESAGRYQRA